MNYCGDKGGTSPMMPKIVRLDLKNTCAFRFGDGIKMVIKIGKYDIIIFNQTQNCNTYLQYTKHGLCTPHWHKKHRYN